MAHKWGLYKHIRFNSQVEEARWDERTYKWQIIVKRLGGLEQEIAEVYGATTDFLISAVGQLSRPKYPDVKGLDTFEGKIMHSARWDWDYDLRNARVGIIGTGATAAQIIPEVAKHSAQLQVFQRTPTYVMPRHDHPISPSRQAMYKYLPLARRRYRASLMDFRESNFEGSFDPTGGKHQMITTISQGHMLSQLPGAEHAELRRQLSPDYPFSCKRIIVSDDLYPAFTRPNVHLETRGIAEITSNGVTMQDGSHHALDLLILATGFHANEFLQPIRILGRNGTSLSSIWSKGAFAHLGMTVPGLPNFAMLYGPNTNLAYNSEILQIEAQSLYIQRIIRAVLASKTKTPGNHHAGEGSILILPSGNNNKGIAITPNCAVTQAYNQTLQDVLSRSTFANPACTSWFKDENGKIVNNWSGSAVEYQKRICFLDWADYDVEGDGSEAVHRRGVERWRRRVEETQVQGKWLKVGAAAGLGLLVLGGGVRQLGIGGGVWQQLAVGGGAGRSIW